MNLSYRPVCPRAGPDRRDRRFSRDDLFTAIFDPSLDISRLYRTTLIETRDGRVYPGMIAFESADGVILQTGATTSVRIAMPDIDSLMPAGLLKDLKPTDLADLCAYLQTLAPRVGTNR